MVFQAVHQNPSLKIFWHLDHNFIGVTKESHQIAVGVDPGEHTLILVDNLGNELQSFFTVLD